jgi:RNA polymerase sigma-70 factor, ECF subfamily
MAHRDDVIVRLNRAVALAEVKGVSMALAEVEGLDSPGLENFLPYHAVRADLLRRVGRNEEARAAYDQALSLGPASAERLWLQRQRGSLAVH